MERHRDGQRNGEGDLTRALGTRRMAGETAAQVHHALLHPHEVVFAGEQEIRVLDLDVKEKTDEVPVVMIPGFSETGQGFVHAMKELNKHGRRALAVDNFHGIDVPRRQRHPHHPQLRKALAIIAALEAKGIVQADIVAHSEGAIVAAVAAMLRPDLVRSIVLYNPAGLYGNDNFFTLAARFGIELVRQQWNALLGRTGEKKKLDCLVTSQMIDYLLSGIVQSIREVFSIAAANIAPVLKRMQQEHGIRVGIISTKQDLLFPLGRSRRKIFKQTGVPPVHCIFHHGGTHVAHVEQPDIILREAALLLGRMNDVEGATTKTNGTAKSMVPVNGLPQRK